jgi:RNA polymerase sigma factor (sigma-70 family)
MGNSPQAFAPARHRAILCVDIAAFAAPHRTDADRIAVRDALYEALRSALARAGVPMKSCHLEDRGDGAVVLVPAEVPKRLLAAAPDELAAVLREHNRHLLPEARTRLRLSLHAGEVHDDSHGVFGEPIHLAFRLLDSAPLKRTLANASGELAVIVSEWFYKEVIRHDPALNPAAYRPVTATAKEITAKAWIRAFPDPHLPAQGTADHDPRQASTDGNPPGTHPITDDFDQFYLSNYRLVRNVINARAQDWTLAEEVTDEAMAIAYRKWDDLREHPSPVGFVIVTARRILSRTQRQRARKNPPGHPLSLEATPGLELKATAAGPEDIAVNRTALEQALRNLPTDQRECLILHEILGHPIRQIAELLNLPEGTVKTRLRAAIGEHQPEHHRPRLGQGHQPRRPTRTPGQP